MLQFYKYQSIIEKLYYHANDYTVAQFVRSIFNHSKLLKLINIDIYIKTELCKLAIIKHDKSTSIRNPDRACLETFV